MKLFACGRILCASCFINFAYELPKMTYSISFDDNDDVCVANYLHIAGSCFSKKGGVSLLFLLVFLNYIGQQVADATTYFSTP
jgi:hypothetical protein